MRNRLSSSTCSISRYNLNSNSSTEFVIFIYHDLLASRDQLLLDLVPKVIVDVAEGKGVFVDVVVLQPLHRFVELVILGLQIFKLQLLS